MMKKLTLSVEPEVIAKAHRLAKAQNTSVSAIFSRMIRFLARPRRDDQKIGRFAREATGLAKWPAGKSERDVLTDALIEKYERS